MLTAQQARKVIRRHLSPVGMEVIATTEALGRVLGCDVCVQEDSPSFDNSAMDGYALRLEDLKKDSLPVQLEIPAGASSLPELQPGMVARIFTGAMLPPGANVIIKQEDAKVLDNGEVQFQCSPQKGDFIRAKASDLRKGEPLLSQGTRLRAGHVALLASQGIYKVEVMKKPSLGYIVTGNELAFEGDELKPGYVRSCNGEIFQSLLSPFCEEIVDYGQAKDNLQEIRAKLELAQVHDVFLISGGASVGKYDYTKELLHQLGYTIQFQKIALRPGKPLVFATKDNHAVFGVPGNPVSSFVSSHLFLRHALACLQGWDREQKRFLAKLKSDVRTPKDFDMVLRGVWGVEGSEILVDTQLNQSSGALGVLATANCLVNFQRGKENFSAGEMVEVLPLEQEGDWS